MSAIRTSRSPRLGSSTRNESVFASSRALTMSISFTEPFSRALRLEELLLAGADRAVLQLPLDDLQALLDLLLVHRRAVPPEQELHDIGGHRVLPAVPPHEVLANEVAVEGRSRELVQMVEFHVTCHLQRSWLLCRPHVQTHRQ